MFLNAIYVAFNESAIYTQKEMSCQWRKSLSKCINVFMKMDSFDKNAEAYFSVSWCLVMKVNLIVSLFEASSSLESFKNWNIFINNGKKGDFLYVMPDKVNCI